MRSTRSGSWHTAALPVALAAIACGGTAASPQAGGATTPSEGASMADDGAPIEESPPAAEAPPAEAPAAPAPPKAPAAGDADVLLAEHNRYRAQHCAEPLAWSPALAASAQAWADHLHAAGCAFAHSETPHGENLAAGTSGALTANDVVTMWYREVSAYDFRRGDFAMETGHFTQLVWRGTARLGCGKATCRRMDIWVCQYDPPGNVQGRFAANVKPTGCR